MQQFTVPQFIDVENQIIGPITTRQFMIFLAGAIIIAASYKLFDFSLFVTIAVIVFTLAASFAFVKVNGRPFHFLILNVIQTLRRPGLRVWNNQAVESVADTVVPAAPTNNLETAPKLYKKSRLAELALVVDTKGRYKGE